MQISDFEFDLPDDLIAQIPPERRDDSKLLVVNRENNSFSDLGFADLVGLLGPDDILVLNDTQVFPARLIGTLETGGRVEIFLVEEMDGIWKSLARPAKRLRPGKRIIFSEKLTGEVAEKNEDGSVLIRFYTDGDFYSLLDKIGKTPLPPYIKRDRTAVDVDVDRARYQTVFAKNRGAIAAPTAGLHFTPEILSAVSDAGVTIASLTLHVGYGTFEPVKATDMKDHSVSAERYSISKETADVLNDALESGRRIVAVGTTTTRALESNMAQSNRFVAGQHSATITITPGYEFKAVGAMLTNFHLPQSSLLILVSTFGGHELIMNAYKHGVAERYRFYSYGDCMFIF